MLKEAENPSSRVARLTGNQRKLHSIHGVLRGRVVDGRFEVQGQPYRFSFVPATAALVVGRLVLTGRMTVQSSQLSMRLVDAVEARLVAAVAHRNSTDEPNIYVGSEDGTGERAGD